MSYDILKVHVIFDLERDRFNARNFLKELTEQNWPLQITGASKRLNIDPTQKETVLVDTMRQATRALVLISPASALSRNLVERGEALEKRAAAFDRCFDQWSDSLHPHSRRHASLSDCRMGLGGDQKSDLLASPNPASGWLLDEDHRRSHPKSHHSVR